MAYREATARIRRQYDAYAARYDLETGWYERLRLSNIPRTDQFAAHNV